MPDLCKLTNDLGTFVFCMSLTICNTYYVFVACIWFFFSVYVKGILKYFKHCIKWNISLILKSFSTIEIKWRKSINPCFYFILKVLNSRKSLCKYFLFVLRIAATYLALQIHNQFRIVTAHLNWTIRPISVVNNASPFAKQKLVAFYYMNIMNEGRPKPTEKLTENYGLFV